MNCRAASTATLGLAGVTAMDVTLATVSAAVELKPLSEAEIVLEPAATPVARPAALIVATVGVEDIQVAREVTFAVEPSL